MPRRTRPPARRRHTRAHVRFHRDRIVAVRIAAHRRVVGEDVSSVPGGRHENEQWLMGCHRAACGVCHPRDDGRRARGSRAWRSDWDV